MNKFTSSWMLRHPNPVDVRAEHITREGQTLKPAKGIVQPPFFLISPAHPIPPRERRHDDEKEAKALSEREEGRHADT